MCIQINNYYYEYIIDKLTNKIIYIYILPIYLTI